MTMPADRERDRRNLQDLAKMAGSLTPPPPSVAANSGIQSMKSSGVLRAAESSADDSGIVDLAAASQVDPDAAIRAQSTALASQGLFEDESVNVHRPTMPSAPPPASFGGYAQPMQPIPTLLPPVPASVPPAAISQDAFASSPNVAPSAAPSLTAFDTQELSALPSKKKGSGKAVAIVLALVAVSAAAGGFFYVKSQKSAVATAPVQKMEQPAAAKVEAPAKPVVAEAAPSPEPTPEEPTLDPNALPTTPTTATRGKVAAATKGAKAAPAAFAPAAPAKADGPAKVTEKDLAAAPSGPAGDLGKAMQAEVGDTGKATPAAGGPSNAPTGNVPQKPSQGAVTGALGAVLPGARACLGPDDPISRAAVIFNSGGTVQSVSVSGNAAGKPAEACIKGALMKAKVQPFAEATYTAPVTIRHN